VKVFYHANCRHLYRGVEHGVERGVEQRVSKIMPRFVSNMELSCDGFPWIFIFCCVVFWNIRKRWRLQFASDPLQVLA